MTPAGESILYSIVASIICDVGKYGLGRFKNKKMTFETKDAEKYVSEHLDKKYEVLSNSGIMEEFLKSSLIVDIINNYTIYAITGQLEAGLALKGIEKKTKSKCFEELDVVNFLTENSYGKYIKAKAIMVPEKQLLQSFFKDVFALCSDYILGKLSLEESAKLYFISNKINILGNGVVSRLDKIESTLEKSMHSEVVYSNEKLLEDKKYYTKILKDNHRMAHIYLLDKFDINKFYVPPFLTCRIEKGRIVPPIYRMNMFNDGFEDWKYIFERSNIVYVTGGAGYGKSLFMKKLIGEYEKLNIIDANEYMVIYGELKNFFVNNASDPLPVVDFLQNSMKRETLIEEMRVSKELINYYLKRGRCIILFDALDEVDKEKRQDLHSHILPDGVYSIGINNGKRKIINNKDTYATNIYYLLMDSFMLENTFGEYSYQQIKNIIQNLNKKGAIEKEELDWIKKVIDKIGEKTIKKKLIQLYERKILYKMEVTTKSSLISMLLEEQDEKKIIKIREILENND